MVQPIQYTPLNDPADVFAKWQQIAANKQEMKLRDLATQERQGQLQKQQQFSSLYQNGNRPTLDQVYSYSPEMGMEQERNQQAMHYKKLEVAKGIATQIKSKMLQSGLTPEHPQFQATLDTISKPFRPYLAGVFGAEDKPDQPMHWDSVSALADMTPQEQSQQKTAQTQAELDARLNFEREKAGINNQFDYQKMDRQAKNQMDLEAYKNQLEMAKDQAKSKMEKPVSEYQQFQIEEKKNKKQEELQSAINNIDDTILDFKNLQNIQSNTNTGPIAGSDPVVGLRKMLPDSIGGGDNLQRLETGYNNLAVKALAAFKAGGVSFGQLSNKEGEWVRSTSAQLNKGSNINKEILQQGLDLLEKRRARLVGNNEGRGASGSWGNASEMDNDPGFNEWLKKKGY